MQATVMVNAYFANIQEDGGVKSPVKGQAIALPVRGNIPKALQKSGGAREALRRPKAFTGYSSRSGNYGIWERKGKKRYPIKALFIFKRHTTVPARFGFAKTAKQEAQMRFGRHFEKRLEYAIRTAKL